MSSKTVCDTDQCTGCSACLNICTHDAIRLIDTLDAYNVEIDSAKCINCEMCSKICPQNKLVEKHSPVIWKQGWTKDEGDRSIAASGGLAIAIEKAFIKNGGICYTCIFNDGRFVFNRFSNDYSLNAVAGSKYVKSTPGYVFKDIKADIMADKRVLFVGLPCQVAGVLNFLGKRTENLFTIDLICHGSPSPVLLEKFLEQYSVSLNSIKDISFRRKNYFGLEKHKMKLVREGLEDRYTYTFLKGINYTECCYKCHYAGAERISDITLGDSWGSELSSEEKEKGISLILCQTEKGRKLLQMIDAELYDVDIDIARSNNKQLNQPMVRPQNRELFFKQIKAGKSYNYSVFCAAPKMVLKQNVKKVLLSFGLYGGGY